jgi:PKD repeat protein
MKEKLSRISILLLLLLTVITSAVHFAPLSFSVTGNIPPVANFTYSPSMPSVDYATTFDASVSYDEDGTIILYVWDFGDTGTASTNETEISHVYTAAGNYTVKLTVIDNDGLNDTMTIQITVLPAIAWLEIQPPHRLVLSEEFEIDIAIKHLAEDWRLFGIQFNLAYDTSLLEVVNASSGPFLESFPWTSSSPYTYVFFYPKPTYVTIIIGLLDGGAEPPGYIYPNGEGVVARVRFRTTENVAMHTSYPISFTISNVLFGNVTAQPIPNYPSIGADYYIRIDPPVPEFSYKPLEPMSGETVTFNASASHDTSPFDNVTIVSYEWDFSDGTMSTGMISTHAYGEPGTYSVTLTVTDNNGNVRSITKSILISRGYLTVNLDVGTIHFRGEIAEFYIQTSVWGTPINVSTITATLYFGAQQQDLTSLVTQVDTGLYRISYAISPTASEGTWLLVAKANYLALSGTNMKTFLISATLTNWGAQLTSINNGVATIQTDVDTIKINLADLNATIVGVQNGIVTISTDVGTIKTSLSAINATVIDIQDGIATLSTDLGEVKVSVDQLGTDTTEVKNRLPVDTGTIVTVLYVATILAAVATILSFYGLYKTRKSP